MHFLGCCFKSRRVYYVGYGHLALVSPVAMPISGFCLFGSHPEFVDTQRSLNSYAFKASAHGNIHATTTHHLHTVTSLFSVSFLSVTQTPAVSLSNMCLRDGEELAQLECRNPPLWTLCLQRLRLKPHIIYFPHLFSSQHNLKVPDLDAGKINSQNSILYKSNETFLLN